MLTLEGETLQWILVLIGTGNFSAVPFWLFVSVEEEKIDHRGWVSNKYDGEVADREGIKERKDKENKTQ